MGKQNFNDGNATIITGEAMDGNEEYTYARCRMVNKKVGSKVMSNQNETTESVTKIEYPIVEKTEHVTTIHLNENVYAEISTGSTTIRLIEHSNPNSHHEQLIECSWEYVRNHDGEIVRNSFAQLRLYASGTCTANISHGCTMLYNTLERGVKLDELFKAYEGLKSLKKILGVRD